MRRSSVEFSAGQPADIWTFPEEYCWIIKNTILENYVSDFPVEDTPADYFFP